MSSLLEGYVDAFNGKDTSAVAALFEDPNLAIAHGADDKGKVGQATSDVLRFLGPGRLALGRPDGEGVVAGVFLTRPADRAGGFGRLAVERDCKIVQIFLGKRRDPRLASGASG